MRAFGLDSKRMACSGRCNGYGVRRKVEESATGKRLDLKCRLDQQCTFSTTDGVIRVKQGVVAEAGAVAMPPKKKGKAGKAAGEEAVAVDPKEAERLVSQIITIHNHNKAGRAPSCHYGTNNGFQYVLCRSRVTS